MHFSTLNSAFPLVWFGLAIFVNSMEFGLVSNCVPKISKMFITIFFLVFCFTVNILWEGQEIWKISHSFWCLLKNKRDIFSNFFSLFSENLDFQDFGIILGNIIKFIYLPSIFWRHFVYQAFHKIDTHLNMESWVNISVKFKNHRCSSFYAHFIFLPILGVVSSI